MATEQLDQDLSKYQPIELKVEEIKNSSRKGATWINDGSVSPVDLYCYLKARFGKPNGLCMLARSPSSDNLIQWHYSIRREDVRIDILGLNSHMEIMAGGDREYTQDEIRNLALALKQDFKNYGEGMAAARKSLERWTLFVNPFARIEAVIAKLREELEELRFEVPARPPSFITKKAVAEYSSKMNEVLPKHFQAQFLGTCLRMLVPVMAESFVNLMIFCLAKKEIREDDRVYDRLIRTEIDVRLSSLHLYCNGFAKQLNREDAEVKNFLTLMNRRNDLLHGNIDPLKLKFDEVFFDGTIPLFKDDRSLSARFLENSLKYIEPDEAQADVKTVAAFIGYLLACLEPESRKMIEVVMYEREPGWRTDTNRIGVLFPPHIAEFFVGGDEPPEDEKK